MCARLMMMRLLGGKGGIYLSQTSKNHQYWTASPVPPHPPPPPPPMMPSTDDDEGRAPKSRSRSRTAVTDDAQYPASARRSHGAIWYSTDTRRDTTSPLEKTPGRAEQQEEEEDAVVVEVDGVLVVKREREKWLAARRPTALVR
ncbi:hypothetical protein F4809DRAFT_361989 [Biscogniauxia mediterranea]|nr:hypothetical protein F4809DRAFT_361989 [Biscogniauxia mediterranea]